MAYLAKKTGISSQSTTGCSTWWSMLLAYNLRNPPAHYQPPNHWPTNRWSRAREFGVQALHVALEAWTLTMGGLKVQLRPLWPVTCRKSYKLASFTFSEGDIQDIYIYAHLSIYKLFNCKSGVFKDYSSQHQSHDYSEQKRYDRNVTLSFQLKKKPLYAPKHWYSPENSPSPKKSSLPTTIFQRPLLVC